MHWQPEVATVEIGSVLLGIGSSHVKGGDWYVKIDRVIEIMSM
jgi:hypothetical protein